MNVTVRDLRFENTPLDFNVLHFDGVANGTIADLDATPFRFASTGSVYVGVVGDGNTVTGLTGANPSVIGDHNRVADSSLQGYDLEPGLVVDGDGNVVENVTANGHRGLVVTGADNRVANGSFNGVLATAGAVPGTPPEPSSRTTPSAAAIRASGSSTPATRPPSASTPVGVELGLRQRPRRGRLG